MPTIVFSQEIVLDSSQYPNADKCKERGHVRGSCTTTMAYCPSYVIDYPDSSVEVTPVCNQIECKCDRCGQIYTVEQKEIRQIIWKRK